MTLARISLAAHYVAFSCFIFVTRHYGTIGTLHFSEIASFNQVSILLTFLVKNKTLEEVRQRIINYANSGRIRQIIIRDKDVLSSTLINDRGPGVMRVTLTQR